VDIPGSLSPALVVDQAMLAAIKPSIATLKNQALKARSAGTDAEKHRLWKSIFGDALPLP